MASKSTRLTNTFIKNVKAGKKPKRYSDGPGAYGLTILVKLTNAGGSSKSFCQRIRINGKRRDLGLGPWPVVTLAEAREKALDNARRVARGEDILKPAPTIPTVDQIFDIVIEKRRPSWKGENTEGQWRLSQRYCRPISSMPVSEVRQKDVIDILGPIWHEKKKTARELRSNLGTVMQWAISRELRTTNPAAGVIQELGRQDPPNHYESLPYPKLGAALALIRDADAWWATKCCLIFTAFTGVRSGEARMATWDEIDWEELTFTLSRSRMKNGEAHKVPLAPQVVEFLQYVRDQNGGKCEGLIFPPERGDSHMDRGRLSSLMKKLGIPAHPHGFRASFRKWSGSRADISDAVAETTLAHKQPTPVRQAYLDTQFFEERLPVMDQWADFLTQTMGPVIPTTLTVPGDEQKEREASSPIPTFKSEKTAVHSDSTGQWFQSMIPNWESYMTTKETE